MNSIPNVLRTGLNDPNNNLWSPFLGGPKTLTEEDRERMGYDRYGLPFFYTRGANNGTLLNTVEGLMDERRKSTFHITTLFPPVNTNQLNFNFNTYIFDQHVAGFIPSEGVSPVVTSREEASSASVERRGIALKLDLESLMTEEGLRHYQLSMIQLADTVIRGMQMDAMKKLMSARRHDVVWDIDSEYVTMEQVISREISTFMSLQKDSRRLPILLEENKARMLNRNNTTPNMFITHPRTALYATMVADNNINFSKRGDKGPATFDAGPEGYTTVQGIPVYLSEPFMAPQRGAPLVDPLRHRMEVGEYAIMDSQGVPHMDRRFRTRDRDIQLYDEDRDTWVRIGFRNALYHVNRFDPEDGDLEDTPDEYLSGLSGGNGGGGSGGSGGGDGDMFVYRDPNNGDPHVCEIFGDMEEEYLPEDELDKVVDTLLMDDESLASLAKRASSYFPDAYILPLLQGHNSIVTSTGNVKTPAQAIASTRLVKKAKTQEDFEELSQKGPNGGTTGNPRTEFKSRLFRRAVMQIYNKCVDYFKDSIDRTELSTALNSIHGVLETTDPNTGEVNNHKIDEVAKKSFEDIVKALSATATKTDDKLKSKATELVEKRIAALENSTQQLNSTEQTELAKLKETLPLHFAHPPHPIVVAARVPKSIHAFMRQLPSQGTDEQEDSSDVDEGDKVDNVFARRRPAKTGLKTRGATTLGSNQKYTDNLDKRYRRGMNPNGNMYQQTTRWWARLLFLTSPINKRVLDKMMEMDVYVPFNVLLFRPNINHDTLSGVMTVGGGEAGFTAIGNRSFTMNDSAFDKTRYAHLTYYTAAIMPDERKAMIVPDIYCVGYNGGNDTQFHTRATAERFAEQRPRPQFKNGVPSIFAVLVPGNYMPPLMLDIRGRFGEFNPLQTNIAPHYPTAHFYNRKYRFQDWQQVNERNVEYFTMVEELTNTICVQGAQIYMNGMEVKNRGHLGHTYPGCAEVRRGETTQLREQ